EARGNRGDGWPPDALPYDGMGDASRSGAAEVIRSAGSFSARSRPKIGRARNVNRPPRTKPAGTERSWDRKPRPVWPPTLPRLPTRESNDTSVARSELGMDACRYVWRTGDRTPPATAPSRNTGTATQNVRNVPVATMVAEVTAAAPSRMVVRRRPGFTSRPTRTLPAMPANENTAAIRPESQMAFVPYSCRK